MKLLTFLGKGRYQETTYTWQGQSHSGRFSPVASHSFLTPDETIVFLTEEADQLESAAIYVDRAPKDQLRQRSLLCDELIPVLPCQLDGRIGVAARFSHVVAEYCVR